MNQEERRQFETRLVVAWGKILHEPGAVAGLVPELAKLLTSHEDFAGLLNSCAPAERAPLYDAIAPHLPFEPYSVETYMAQMKERAGKSESRLNPITVGAEKYREVPERHATGVVVTFTCARCPRSKNYYGDTPVNAVIQARQDGWVRDVAIEKEICPKCPAAARPQRRKCPGCTKRHYPPDCRVIAKLSNRVN